MKGIIALLGALALHAGAQPLPDAADQHLSDNMSLAAEVARFRVPPSDLKKRVLDAFAQKLALQHSAELDEALKAEIDRQYAERLEPAAVRAAAEIYAQNYGRAELEQLRAFYATRTGQLLFGKDDFTSSHQAEAVEAANSPSGRAFLHSSIGQRENKSVAALAERAATDAIRAAMPLVINAVQTRLLEAQRSGAAR